jgi:hypothetical protein
MAREIIVEGDGNGWTAVAASPGAIECQHLGKADEIDDLPEGLDVSPEQIGRNRGNDLTALRSWGAEPVIDQNEAVPPH